MLGPSCCVVDGMVGRGAVQVRARDRAMGGGAGAEMVIGLLGRGVDVVEEAVECSQCVVSSIIGVFSKSSDELNLAKAAGRDEAAFLTFSALIWENISGSLCFDGTAFLGAIHMPVLGAVRATDVDVV